MKFQVVLSPVRLAPGRLKIGTCERGLRLNKVPVFYYTSLAITFNKWLWLNGSRDVNLHFAQFCTLIRCLIGPGHLSVQLNQTQTQWP
jgi:hypothetical protein